VFVITFKTTTMLVKIADLPSHVLGINAIGEVTAHDIETVLLPGLQALVDKYDEIYYLLVLDTDVGNFTAGSWLQDMKLGLKHFTKWKKIAVVTHQGGVEKFTDLFSVLVPGEAKGYNHAQLAEAMEWISQK
jgi:SpoIIAA-like